MLKRFSIGSVFISAILCLFGFIEVLGSAPAGGDVALGSTVGGIQVLDADHRWRTLEELAPRRAVVLAFVRCSGSESATALARLAELERSFRGRPVQFLAVDPDPSDRMVELAGLALEQGVEFDCFQDLDASAARAVGAGVTPEVVVLDAERKLRYRGRLATTARGESIKRRQDLREALEDVLAGVEVRVQETPAEGERITRGPWTGLPARTTYAEHVAPILQRHCTACHTVGGAAPFAFAYYDDVRPRARRIAEMALSGAMPPWSASERCGPFANRPSLLREEVTRLVDWELDGAPEGDVTRLPAAAPRDAWRIGEPDLVLAADQPAKVPALGPPLDVELVLPHRFEADTLVTAVELKLPTPRAVRHAELTWAPAGAPPGAAYLLALWSAGEEPLRLDPGVAVRIPAGASLRVRARYEPIGRPLEERIEVALRVARGAVARELATLVVEPASIAVTDGDPAFAVAASAMLEHDTQASALWVLMSARGRDVRVVATGPDGSEETLLLAPCYDATRPRTFRWPQPGRVFVAGTRLGVFARFDGRTRATGRDTLRVVLLHAE